MLDAHALDAAVDACAGDSFAYLERLVAADSTLGREQAAVTVFAEQMTSLGFTVDKIELPADLADDPRAGVVQHTGTPRLQAVARRGPDTGPSLLLNGHIDVVPAETPERWTSPPFAPTRRDGRLFGRGAGDMKGGFAMGALALQALDRVVPDLQTGPLSFLAAIEEECTGNGTLAACRDGVLADAVVVLEPTDLGIMVGGVGILWCDLDVDGVSAHAEAAHDAVNPVDLAMQLVEGLRRWSAELAEAQPDPALATQASPYNLNLGQIRAGDWGSSVPATASTRLRIAFPRAWSPDEAEQRVRLQVETLAADFPTPPRLRLSGFRASGYLLEPDHALVTAVGRAHEHAHGERPPVFSLGSTTDARTYLNDFDVPALCYGPAVTDIHGIDESVELASIVAGAKTLARFLVAFYRPDRLPA